MADADLHFCAFNTTKITTYRIDPAVNSLCSPSQCYGFTLQRSRLRVRLRPVTDHPG